MEKENGKPSAEYVRERLDYEPKSGVLIWRPIREQKPWDRAWNAKNAGKVAGNKDTRGHLRVVLCGRTFAAHTLAWVHYYGEWPIWGMDHRNRNKTDNRISNLRPTDPTGNARNASLRNDNTSGVKGVGWHKASQKWSATIRVNYKTIHLGLFTNKEKAQNAYKKAAYQYFGEFSSPLTKEDAIV